MLPRFVIGVVVLTACVGEGDDSGTLEGGVECTVLTSGTYTFTGEAWGMGDFPMAGDITMDADSCSFTIDNWDMEMDDLPSGGVLDGDQAQLDGLNSYWRSCTGTADSETHLSGTCSDDGAGFDIAAI